MNICKKHKQVWAYCSCGAEMIVEADNPNREPLP